MGTCRFQIRKRAISGWKLTKSTKSLFPWDDPHDLITLAFFSASFAGSEDKGCQGHIMKVYTFLEQKFKGQVP
jgi:hypothetical protein